MSLRGTSTGIVADIRAMAEHVASQSGYRPTSWIMSPRQKEEYERFTVWFAEAERRLRALPRRKYLSRRVLEIQMYGYPTETSIKQWIRLRVNRASRAISLRVWKLRGKIGL